MESIDKAIHGMVSKSSGRNGSERIGDLENPKSSSSHGEIRGAGKPYNREHREVGGRPEGGEGGSSSGEAG